MKLATTTGDFLKWAGTPAEAVRLYDGTGFRHLDYNFYRVIRPGSPFLGDRWLDEVEDAGRDEYFRRNLVFFQSLFPAMETWNVNVLVENSAERNMGGFYFLMTGEEMRAFADLAGHPLLHCNWDTGHANMRGTDQKAEIVAMGDHLRGLHVQDNFGTFDEHMAPFMGTLDIDAVMQGLVAIGYKGYFTFEADNMLLVGRWPHARRESPSVTERRLALPPADSKSPFLHASA